MSRRWVYLTSVDALGKRYAEAITEGRPPEPGAESMYLSVRCRDGAFDVVVDPGFHLGYTSTDIRYSIDGAPPSSATWRDDGGWITYRGGSVVAFAELLARSTTLGFTARGRATESQIVERTVRFDLEGLAPHLPAVRSMCGV